MPLNPVPNYPTSLDSLPDPTSTTYTDDDGFELDLLLQKLNAIVELLQARVGIGASNGTPVASRILGADGTGTSSWRQLVNADVASAAAIAYGKLNLATSIVNADIAAAAAIAQSKLGAMDRVLAYKSAAAQSVANTTETTITFDAESYDSNTMHDNSTNNGRLTAPSTGFYIIFGVCNFAADADGIRDVYVRLNGTTRLMTARAFDNGAVGPYVPIFLPYPLTAADYVEMRVWHSAGNALDVQNGASNTNFGMYRLSA